MKAKIRNILEECIERGVEYGLARAHKHTDSPETGHIVQEIDNAIWLEIDERFVFDSDTDS